jgi:ABC-type lipoprotein release transport system permease subunit
MVLRLALRNVLRQKRRTLFTMLTMFGGFVLSSVSIGWQYGAYYDVIGMFTSSRTGHIQVHAEGYLDKPTLYSTIDQVDLVAGELEQVRGVESWTARVYSAALVQVNEQSSGSMIIGFDPARESSATGFENQLIEGRMLSPEASGEMLIGDGLAVVLEAEVGDRLVLLSQASNGTIANEAYRILGIVDSGDPQTDRVSCYMHIDDARELFLLEGRAHEIAVITTNLGSVDRTTNRIREALEGASLVSQGLDVEPWQEFAREFYEAMQADVQGMWIMLGVIMVVVGVGVLNTVLMSVLERRREYGVLRAIGTRPFVIVRLVLVETAIMAVMSILLALPVSMLGLHILAVIGLKLPVPMEFGGIQFTHMRAMITPASLWVPAATVFLTAMIVGFAPALKAARTKPAVSMRMH